MKTNDIRQSFLNYFAKHKHEIVSSSSLIPDNDPTLLFNNAGMNQFKNVFLGLENRGYNRATSSQKCVRAGGKHNDLENVGHTARHHVFFEMLGNFSFGDYFKKEAIHFAWDFLTNELKIPKDKLYVTVFETDDEAAEIWHNQEKVPKDRIYRFGEKDNFWRMGKTGPCGPCSEIFYDLGEDVGGDPKANVMGGEGDRYMEIWNLVFMQYDEAEDGTLNPLPSPSIDTGAGLERLAAVMQNELSNYHTDLFRDILDSLGRLCHGQYIYDTRRLKGKDLDKILADNVAYRVLADHARAAAFLISDGVLPSNEGRGYVLRRIMRRAIRYGRKLSEEASLLPHAAEKVIELMNSAYPELKQQQSLILTTIKDEEKRFLQTLDQGTNLLHNELTKLKKENLNIVSGDFSFKLYDTFGFPVDLTRIMAEEQGFKVNEVEFEKNMQKAREKAKSSWKASSISTDMQHMIKSCQSVCDTEFTGYDGRTTDKGNIVALSNGKKILEKLEKGEAGFVLLDKTCFYAESGGQAGDSGKILTSTGQAEVIDCRKQGNTHVHHIKITEGFLDNKQEASLQVYSSVRRQTAANHSATHLLHAALKKVLGDHVSQAGSLVEADRLRFDFTHSNPVSNSEVKQIESLVNDEISKQISVGTEIMSPEKATQAGALALFGEKYGDEVRVVRMGEFSMELCGGTHVENTAMIRLFKIVSEGGVSSGVRRIEAITGDRATEFLLKNTQENQIVREAVGFKDSWESYLNEEPRPVMEWVDGQREQNKKLQKQLQSAQGKQIDLNQLISEAQDTKAGKLVMADIAMDDRKVLTDITDKLKNKLGSGVVVIIGQGDKSNPIIVSVSKDLIKDIKAGSILKEVAGVMGGKGGGRPDFAQGAAPDRSKIKEAFAKAESLLN